MIFNVMDKDLTEDPERIDFTPNDHLTVCPDYNGSNSTWYILHISF